MLTLLGTIYGIGFGITLTILTLIKMVLIFMAVHQKETPLLIRILRLVLWPITWYIVIRDLWKLYKEESRDR